MTRYRGTGLRLTHIGTKNGGRYAPRFSLAYV